MRTLFVTSSVWEGELTQQEQGDLYKELPLTFSNLLIQTHKVEIMVKVLKLEFYLMMMQEPLLAIFIQTVLFRLQPIV